MMDRMRAAYLLAAVGCICVALMVCADLATAADRRAVVQRSRALLSAAQAAFAAGETDSALIRLNEVLVEDPANPDAFYFIGLIMLSEADTSGAEVALVEGVTLAPLSRRLKLLLARVWTETGKTDEAEELVNEVMSIRPRDLDALYIKGLIALARNDSTTAMEFWDTALAEELGEERP
jgi:cytochrome c-type biogenesis protein CcmH/NrfG